MLPLQLTSQLQQIPKKLAQDCRRTGYCKRWFEISTRSREDREIIMHCDAIGSQSVPNQWEKGKVPSQMLLLSCHIAPYPETVNIFNTNFFQSNKRQSPAVLYTKRMGTLKHHIGLYSGLGQWKILVGNKHLFTFVGKKQRSWCQS